MLTHGDSLPCLQVHHGFLCPSTESTFTFTLGTSFLSMVN